MNKIIITLAVVAFIGIVGGYLYMGSTQPTEVVTTEPSEDVMNSSPENATYSIEGESVTLINGSSEKETVPGSSATLSTNYFGNDVSIDLDNDGRDDKVFLITQSTGGTGTFFYVVAALNTENGWVGSKGLLLGDRIAPQTTEVSSNPNHKNVIVVNYMDHADNEAMSEQPSVGKSIWLKLDTDSMQFGEVEQNFEGEANPDIMTLDMKTWNWVKTTYNNDTEVTPNKAGAFTLTFGPENVSMTTDCNSMSGPYEANKGQIIFGSNMIATEMFCMDSQQDAFAAMLIDAQTYTFTSKGELVLGLKLDSGSVIFQ